MKKTHVRKTFAEDRKSKPSKASLKSSTDLNVIFGCFTVCLFFFDRKYGLGITYLMFKYPSAEVKAF